MLGVFDGYNSSQGEDGNFLTAQQVKKDLVGEIDAVLQYGQHIHDSTNKIAKQTWQHIRDEELVHIGELLGLFKFLQPEQFAYIKDGFDEFEEHKTEWMSN